jgi:hypothetical protein
LWVKYSPWPAGFFLQIAHASVTHGCSEVWNEATTKIFELNLAIANITVTTTTSVSSSQDKANFEVNFADMTQKSKAAIKLVRKSQSSSVPLTDVQKSLL